MFQNVTTIKHLHIVVFFGGVLLAKKSPDTNSKRVIFYKSKYHITLTICYKYTLPIGNVYYVYINMYYNQALSNER